MKRLKLIFAIILQFSILLKISAQERKVNMYDSAHVYYKKKDFQKALNFFDIYYIEQKNTQSNYDTYFAAVAAASVGNIDRAKYYVTQSGLVGYDFTNYSFFADDPDNKPLRELPEWRKFISTLKFKSDSAAVIMNKIIAEINDTTVQAKPSLLGDEQYWKGLAVKTTGKQLIQKIKEFNSFNATQKDNFWTLYQVKANDTLTAPFMVHIPKDYQPDHKIPMYVYLHGAVVNLLTFPKPEYIPNRSQSNFIIDKAEKNAIILYPIGKKSFGWISQQEAFETIIKEIEFLKSRYNIDDNKVFIGGHSNGGSGAFWFAMHKPSNFASFYGFNYLPKAYFGNTILSNLKNAPTFYGISGSDDTIFPFTLVNSIYQFGQKNGANWKNFIRTGDHSLPFNTPDSVNFIFDGLATQVRNPFPQKITWETDNIKNGRNAWIEIMALDTLANKADWQIPLNPTLTQNGKTGSVDFNKNKSGAIVAIANGNSINIQTSRVKRIKLYISHDMFDLSQKINITINGKEFINIKLDFDKKIILEEFFKTKDRVFIVANKIELAIN